MILEHTCSSITRVTDLKKQKYTKINIDESKNLKDGIQLENKGNNKKRR